ncbi:MAG: membrane protein insertion efficiency factor YidD [Thermoanaerobaculum sp.]
MRGKGPGASWAARVGVRALRAYKRWVSPLLPPACRFTPTCSEYMAEAIGIWGFWRGFFLGLRRLSRCHPWHPGGFDPVPRRGTGVGDGA